MANLALNGEEEFDTDDDDDHGVYMVQDIDSALNTVADDTWTEYSSGYDDLNVPVRAGIEGAFAKYINMVSLLENDQWVCRYFCMVCNQEHCGQVICENHLYEKEEEFFLKYIDIIPCHYNGICRYFCHPCNKEHISKTICEKYLHHHRS